MKKIKKIIMIIILFLLLAKKNFILAQVNSNYDFDFISSRQINFKTKNLEVTGQLPYINNFKNNLFQNQINQKIEAIYKKKLELAIAKNLKLIKLNYKAKAGKNIISVLIYFSGEINSLETINFNIKTCNFLTLKDILGPNAIEIINKIIKTETIKSPDKYNINFSGINNNHNNFFVDANNLFIVFNEYELSPAIKNIQEFNINLLNIKTKILNPKKYYIGELYNLKMIPLREICEAFDYKISWENNYIKIIKNDFSSTILINKNSYIKNKLPAQTLESAAVIKNNKTYVPISFFKEYLNLFYTTDKDNNIIFTQYVFEPN